MKTRQPVLLAAIAGCLAVVAASFVTAEIRFPGPDSLESLCDSSPLIVDGYVDSVSVPNEGIARIGQALFNVNRVLKGSNQPRQIIVSSIVLERGNRYIVFLREDLRVPLRGGPPRYNDVDAFLVVGDRVRLEKLVPGFLRSKFESLSPSETIAEIESYVHAPRVAGRILVDGGGFPRPGTAWVVVTPVDVKTPIPPFPARAAVAANLREIDFPAIAAPGANTITIGPDGAFTLPLREGTYRVSLDGVPLGYSVRSIQFGSTDLRNELLKIQGSPATEIRITLAADASKPGSSGVKVSGNVTGVPSSTNTTLPPIPLLVSLRTGSQGEIIAGTAPVRLSLLSGAFEFLGIPPGNYTLRVTPPPGIAPDWVFATTTVVVGQKDVKVKLPFQGREVKGQVVAAKDRPKLSEPTGAVMAFDLRGPSGTLGTPSRVGVLTAADNSFSVLLPHGEFTLAPSVRGRSVTSISAGSADLLKTPLRIDGETSVKRILVEID